MKKIRIKFCDGFRGGDKVFLPILKKHYDVEMSESPDYVVYSVFGKENLKHPDAVRIFTTVECCAPDFNACDYATGFDYLDFGDRYLRLPLCSIMFRNGRNVIDLAKDRGRDMPDVREKGFCSLEAAVERVKELDRDDDAYAAMLREPIFSGGVPGLADLETFLCRIFDQDLDRARRRPRSPYAAYWVPMSFRAYIGDFVQRCRRSLECRLSRLGGHGRG